MKLRKTVDKTNWIEYYAVNLANKVNPGYTFSPHTLNEDEIGINYDSVETKSKMRKYLYVISLGKELDSVFFSDLRDHLEQSFKRTVRVNFQVNMSPHKIDMNNKHMRERRDRWIRAINRAYDSRMGKSAGDAALVSINEAAFDEREKWKIDSWKYWIIMDKEKRQLFRTSVLVEIEVSTSIENYKDILYSAAQEAIYRCGKSNIILEPVKNFTLDFLQTFMITSLERMPYSSRLISWRVLSDVIISKFFRLPQGETNPDNSVPVGVDVTNNTIVYKNFIKPHGAAENMAVFGETGSGKSFFLKYLLRNLLLYKFDGIVLDYEGFEYSWWVPLLGAVRIAIGSYNGGYPDTLELAEPTGDFDIDMQSFERSISATVAIFDAIAAESATDGMDHVELAIFDEAFNALHRRYGIVRTDTSTWDSSKQLSYQLLYDEIKTMGEDLIHMDTYGDSLKNLVFKLKPYFEKDGIYSTMFSKKLSMSSIMPDKSKYGKLLIFSFDMQTKSGSGNVEKELAIKQISCTYLATSYCIANRNLGKFTTVIFDEFQRYCKHPGAYKTASDLYTGGRKLNANAILATNSPAELATSEHGYSKDLADNVQSYMLGYMKPATVTAVCKAFGLQNCEDTLLRMFENKDQYLHTFLAALDGKDYVLVKAKVPSALSKSNLFATRTGGEMMR